MSSGVRLSEDWKQLHSGSFTGFQWRTREDLPGATCSSPIWRWQKTKQAVTIERRESSYTKVPCNYKWCEERVLQGDYDILKPSVLGFSSSLMNVYNHDCIVQPWCQNWPKQTADWCNPSVSTRLQISISFISIWSSAIFSSWVKWFLYSEQ